jgi:thioredoxin 2
VVVAKVDSDRATATAQRFGIRSIPTTLLLRTGREVDRIAGAVPLESLLRFVEERL